MPNLTKPLRAALKRHFFGVVRLDLRMTKVGDARLEEVTFKPRRISSGVIRSTLKKICQVGGVLALLLMAQPVFAEDTAAKPEASQEAKMKQAVDKLKAPLYTPFIERYVLDDLKQLRIDMNHLQVSMTKQVTDRELTATNRAVSYATDTVTYFFYLIAGISSVLLLVGWTSLKDVKERVHNFADTKVNKVISEYEQRLAKLEEELNHKSVGIQSAQKRLTRYEDIHSLWLKAAQEQVPTRRLDLYDQILRLDRDNAEALTYKADVVLEMNEPQWAINLCQQALEIDPDNSHAFYQLAGAYALLNQPHDAIVNLELSLKDTEGMVDQVLKDPIFEGLSENPEFQELLKRKGVV
jgi:tetratricopeptide (TPR) repeat protein